MRYPRHTVRAQGFHHQDGYEAKRALAARFAGPEGRLATMEDIIDARLATSIKQTPWFRTYVTDSRLYYGLHEGRPCYAFAHGNGPLPVRKGDLPVNKGKRMVAYSHEPRITQEQFAALIDGRYGKVDIVDLLAYRNPAKARKLDNEYAYADACKDAIVQAFLGRRGKEFLERHRDETRAWLKDHVDRDELGKAMVVRNMLHRHYDGWEPRLREDDAAAHAYPLVLERAYFFHDTDDEARHILGHTELCADEDEQFCGSANIFVGIRGKEPLTDIALDFRPLLGAILRNWSHFVEPVRKGDEFPTCHVLRRPDGLTPMFTQYLEDSSYHIGHPFTQEPRYSVGSLYKKFETRTYTIPIRRPHEAMCLQRAVDAVRPKEANVVQVEKLDEGGFTGTFYKAEVDASRCFRPLAALREDFDWVLDRCQHLGLLKDG